MAETRVESVDDSEGDIDHLAISTEGSLQKKMSNVNKLLSSMPLRDRDFSDVF